MLLSFFRKSSISVIVTSIMIFIVIWLRTFCSAINYPFIFDSVNMPLYSLVVKYLPLNGIYASLLTFLLVISIAFYLLYLNGKYILIKQRTYLPFLFMVLVSSSLVPLQRVNPALFAGLMLVVAVDHIFAFYQKTNAFDHIFRAGLSVGIASLFYAPAIPFYLLLLIGLMLLRSFNVREWLVALFGIALPWGFLLLTYFWLQVDALEVWRLLQANLGAHAGLSIDEFVLIVFFAAIALPVLVALLYLIPSLASQKISVRKFHGVLIWFMLLGVLAYAAIPSCSYEIIYLLAIPLSFHLGNYFTTVRGKFWPLVLFLLIFLAIIFVQVYPYYSF